MNKFSFEDSLATGENKFPIDGQKSKAVAGELKCTGRACFVLCRQLQVDVDDNMNGRVCDYPLAYLLIYSHSASADFVG